MSDFQVFFLILFGSGIRLREIMDPIMFVS